METEASDKVSKMIRQLTGLRGIGVQSATVLVREAFVRRFANGKALGSYAGLAFSPYSSGGIDREQGIGRAGNRRVRTVMVELAWLWTRYQPAAAQVFWFRERVGYPTNATTSIYLLHRGGHPQRTFCPQLLFATAHRRTWPSNDHARRQGLAACPYVRR